MTEGKVVKQTEVIAKIAEAMDISKVQAKATWGVIANMIKEECSAGRQFRIPEVGTVEQVTKPARVCRVPSTGEMKQVPARKVFKLRGRKEAIE